MSTLLHFLFFTSHLFYKLSLIFLLTITMFIAAERMNRAVHTNDAWMMDAGAKSGK